jgi:hypothetical protein
VISLDASTVLAQWATGGLLFCWFTTRRREVGLGYGWLLRGTYLLMGLGAVGLGFRFGVVWGRELAMLGFVVSTAVVLGISIALKSAGVAGQRAEFDRRSARVAQMTGIDRMTEPESGLTAREVSPAAAPHEGSPNASAASGAVFENQSRTREFPPILDLVPVAFGALALVFAALAATDSGSGVASGAASEVLGGAVGSGTIAVALARTLVGAAFLGVISDAMLLGHWYLVQPGLPRRLLNEIVTMVGYVWPAELAVMLLPTGMISVLTGTVDDGWGGTLGWFWVACTITTIALVFVTRAALKERQYSAVMAATGLLYLAILTGFGMDLVARAVLDG